jgi:carbonic anhydrase
MCMTDRKNVLQRFDPSRRSLVLGVAASMGMFMAKPAGAKEIKAPPKPQNVLSPDAALERLRQGNSRYVQGLSLRHDFKHEREALAGGQNPYAAILSCADSRIAPEYAFDSGRGDLFVCRVAGNFASTETIASMEYAVAVLAVPLILVLGHDSCGAVSAAIKIAQGREAAAGSHALTRRSHRAIGKGGVATRRGYAQQRHPAERHRQRRQARLGDTDPECGG